MQLTTLAEIHGLTNITSNDDGSISCNLPSLKDYGLSISYINSETSPYPDTFIRLELDETYSGAGCGAWEVALELLPLALTQAVAYAKVYDEVLEAAA